MGVPEGTATRKRVGGGEPGRPWRGADDHQGRRARAIVDEIRSVARPGQGEKAARAFEQAVSLLERGRDAAAVAPALEAKQLASRSGAVREVLGLALYRTGRYREALRELQAYRRMTGQADQDHLIADSYRGIGAPGKAVETARAALRARLPEEVRAEVAVVAASALADLGRLTEALSILRSIGSRGRSVRPHELRLWYVTGDILERARRPDEAREEFSRIVRHDAEAFDAAERLARLS